MRFWEAMKALEEGKRIRLNNWQTKEYIYLNENGDILDEKQIPCTSDRWCHYQPFHESKLKWEIYQEPKKTYSFMEMLPLLKQGKKFRRKDLEEGYKLKLCPEDDCMIVADKGFGIGDYYPFDCDDFEAKDWIEVKE